MRIRTIGVLAALALLAAACSTTPKETASTSAKGAAPVETAKTEAPAVETAPVKTENVGAEESVGPGPIPGTQEDLVQNVGDRVFFDYDSAMLKPEGRKVLERQARWLKMFPEVTITIEGHADERGTREYNLALGERRAAAAKNYLVALGIEPDRISIISYGKERPVALGHDEKAWAQNRRAVTVLN